jgi:hypothetical protein
VLQVLRMEFEHDEEYLVEDHESVVAVAVVEWIADFGFVAVEWIDVVEMEGPIVEWAMIIVVVMMIVELWMITELMEWIDQVDEMLAVGGIT